MRDISKREVKGMEGVRGAVEEVEDSGGSVSGYFSVPPGGEIIPLDL